VAIFRATPAVLRLASALSRESRRAGRAAEAAVEALAEALLKNSLGLAAWHPDLRMGSVAKARHELAFALARLQASADLGGRLALRWGAPALDPEAFAARAEAPLGDVVPAVVFEEAVRDLEEREPWGAEELRKAGLEVASVYGPVVGPQGEVTYPHGFAAALAVDAEVAKQVRERLLGGLARGTPTSEVAADLAATWTWPRAYSETVVRNAYATATSAGRFREAERVHRAGIPVGFRYSVVHDSNVRRGRPQDHGENHLALDGLTARVDDPVWRSWTPPLGANCRCVLEPRVGDDVPAHFVTVPPGAAKAPGYGTRQDLATYG
jgi:SPP1 gp7 family putative phage head morphogenesis protein